MTKDEELTRYMAMIEQYKEQMSTLEMQSSYIQAAIVDHNKAKITVEHLGKTKKGEEVLLPIGGSTFINATTIDPSKVLIGIGAGLVAEKNYEEAIKKIDERIEELQKTQEKLYTIMQNLQNEATEISIKAQKILAEKQNE